MNVKLLRDAGEALYGPRWQAPLSRDLKVAVRTVQRWDAGDRGIPDTLAAELVELLEIRQVVIDGLVEELIRN